LFEEVYAEDTVPHLLSDKAYAGALRCHHLAQSALVTLIIEFVVEKKNIYLTPLETIYNKAIDIGLAEEEIEQLRTDETAKKVRKRFETYCEQKEENLVRQHYGFNILNMLILSRNSFAQSKRQIGYYI